MKRRGKKSPTAGSGLMQDMTSSAAVSHADLNHVFKKLYPGRAVPEVQVRNEMIYARLGFVPGRGSDY